MNCKGLIYLTENDLAEKLGLPEGVCVTNVVHDPITGNIQIVIRSNEPMTIYTHDVEDLQLVRRIKV